MMKNGDSIELWLDHDLSGDDTIRPVVDYLLTMDAVCECDIGIQNPFSELFIERIYVHSQNASAAENIVRSLQDFDTIRSPLPNLI